MRNDFAPSECGRRVFAWLAMADDPKNQHQPGVCMVLTVDLLNVLPCETEILK